MYERRVPSLAKEVRGLDQKLEALQRQRQAVAAELETMTRVYLERQRAYQRSQAGSAATDDKKSQAELKHARFQFFLVERKLTRLQNQAELLDQDITPLKRRLRSKRRQLQRNKEQLVSQRRLVRNLASGAVAPAERIEIKSSNRDKAKPAALQAGSATAAAPSSAENVSSAAAGEDSKTAAAEASAKDLRHAKKQARRLQELIAKAQPQSANVQLKTLEVQHKGKSAVKQFYDLVYAGADHYTAEGRLRAGKQVFKVASQRWITTIPEYADGANYVFIISAAPHRRLQLTLYNADLLQ